MRTYALSSHVCLAVVVLLLSLFMTHTHTSTHNIYVPTLTLNEKSQGDTTSEMIKEMNVFDHGQGLAAINIGEHAITDEDGMGTRECVGVRE